MVFRLFVERKSAYRDEAESLLRDVRETLSVTGAKSVRIFNRYDVENIEKTLFDGCVRTVFSEAATDDVYFELPVSGELVLPVEYLPGQYDQRSDAAEQCIQLISMAERPRVRTARIYVFSGEFDEKDIQSIRRHLINPVESREASLELPKTLSVAYEEPPMPSIVAGFTKLDEAGARELIREYSLAMDEADVLFCRDHFISEKRDPTVTELKVLDTYWSDHCRHTTFNTELRRIEILDEAAKTAFERYMALHNELRANKPVTLMDMATIGAKHLKAEGKLNKLDESPEINACTVKTTICVDGHDEDWLLLFKNETHNHPTEIEPFGGAATCLGGAIRDPLSGRAYVYQAMRLTGASDPRKKLSETISGKLPQRTIVTRAAAGYSSYGNQIGLATGLVDEVYDPGYEAKRMEIGAVVGAVRADSVRREEPVAGDVVLLLGGRTGRDGCGGATGSSKAHTVESLEKCGAEVQKGNAPEERKLQRLFRNSTASSMIKRCNDFGAGGVSVAIGELADGLDIELDLVPKKYEGLDGTELAISESQERMAVVVGAKDEAAFIELAKAENLSAVRVAVVTDTARLVMRLKGESIVDLPRAFIDTFGASRHTDVVIEAPKPFIDKKPNGFKMGMLDTLSDLNVCSKRGLIERFDSTVGANTVMMPLAGARQRTPMQYMAAKLPVLHGSTDDCSVMAWGFDPKLSKASPYRGAYLAVVESVSKLVSSGAPLDECYLSFQEYFPKPMGDAKRFGLPCAALLGALMAQTELGIAAIGGKDSMSGTFEKLDVPPTLVSFAITMAKATALVSPDLKRKDSRVALIKPEYDADGIPVTESLKTVFARVHALIASGRARSCYTVGMGGIAAAVFKMALGAGLGFAFDSKMTIDKLFSEDRGSFLVELAHDDAEGETIGFVTEAPEFTFGTERVTLEELERAYDMTLESVYPTKPATEPSKLPSGSREVFHPERIAKVDVSAARPRVLIPVFPGTNCEYDSARAFEKAGAEATIAVVNTMDSVGIRDSANNFAKELRNSQILFIPGGFSGGDEPDGSGRFISAFLRAPMIAEEIERLLNLRDGLILGVCNGFQALIKLGLVPYGKFMQCDENAPTLTFNRIGRHQSRIVRTKIASKLSPWLMKADENAIYSVPISHGEGRFVCDGKTYEELMSRGQVATLYVDEAGAPSMDIDANPASSMYALEGLTSPDGRVFGKMGHTERTGEGLYRNVPGEYDMKLFGSAVEYFK